MRFEELSNEEFGWYIDASDCVILPYRKKFQVASGPMTEAIWRRKPIIGPSHSRIGYIIKNYNLGYRFKSENHKYLARVINGYLSLSYTLEKTEKFKHYKDRLNPGVFDKKYIKFYIKCKKI